MKKLDIARENFKKIVSGLVGVEHLQFQGEGEPLLHKEKFELLKIFRQYHPGAKISVTTNGSLMSAEIFKQFMDLKVYSVLVSIESCREERFQYLRGGSLENIILNLKNAVLEKKKKGAAFPLLGFAVTVMLDTFSEFADIVALYRELGLDGEFTIQYLQSMDIYKDIYNDYLLTQIPSPARIAAFEKELVENRELREFLEPRRDLDGFFDDLYGSVPDTPWRCPWLINGMYISSAGFASGCSYIKEPSKGFGNIHNDGIEAILKKRSAARNLISQGIIPGSCRDCHEIPAHWTGSRA